MEQVVLKALGLRVCLNPQKHATPRSLIVRFPREATTCTKETPRTLRRLWNLHSWIPSFPWKLKDLEQKLSESSGNPRDRAHRLQNSQGNDLDQDLQELKNFLGNLSIWTENCASPLGILSIAVSDCKSCVPETVCACKICQNTRKAQGLYSRSAKRPALDNIHKRSGDAGNMHDQQPRPRNILSATDLTKKNFKEIDLVISYQSATEKKFSDNSFGNCFGCYGSRLFVVRPNHQDWPSALLWAPGLHKQESWWMTSAHVENTPLQACLRIEVRGFRIQLHIPATTKAGRWSLACSHSWLSAQTRLQQLPQRNCRHCWKPVHASDTCNCDFL